MRSLRPEAVHGIQMAQNKWYLLPKEQGWLWDNGRAKRSGKPEISQILEIRSLNKRDRIARPNQMKCKDLVNLHSAAVPTAKLPGPSEACTDDWK